MSFEKRNYVPGTTKITADNLNNIQDKIIELDNKRPTKDEIVEALGYAPAKDSDTTPSLSLPLAGGTMQGNIDMAGKDISNVNSISMVADGATNGIYAIPTEVDQNTPMIEIAGTYGDEAVVIRGLATPIENNDAVTKKYVDDKVISGSGAAVSSVNGKTGEVVLKISDLTNDSGYLTEHQSLAAYSTTAQVETLINEKISALPKFYSGTTTPENALGNDGDLYFLKTEE